MGLRTLTRWVFAAYSVGMKTWMTVAVLALAPLSASAQTMNQHTENSRAALLKDVESTRKALLPQTEPLPQVTVRYQPRLNDIKAAMISAKTPDELIKAQKDFGDWKKVVMFDLYSADPRRVSGGESYAGYSARREEEIDFAAAFRQRLAGQRVDGESDDLRAAHRNGAWGQLFDNKSPFASAPVADGAVQAGPALPANDPARYAKIRALLLSKGVSPKIVDIAISEGIRQKVDPMIVLSVINQESNFKKNAHNKGSGCTGLMQLAPATAADMGVHGNLYDPVANIKAGVKYMNWIANSFFKMNLDMSDLSKVPAEKLKMVLASYNWGIGNVQRIVKKYGTAGLDRVAPKETRDYISEIPSRIYNWFASF